MAATAALELVRAAAPGPAVRDRARAARACSARRADRCPGRGPGADRRRQARSGRSHRPRPGRRTSGWGSRQLTGRRRPSSMSRLDRLRRPTRPEPVTRSMPGSSRSGSSRGARRSTAGRPAPRGRGRQQDRRPAGGGAAPRAPARLTGYPPAMAIADRSDARPRGRGRARRRRPVVALESTLISHGLPYPDNVEVARASEAAIRESGAVPATVAIRDGRLLVGLADDDDRGAGTAPSRLRAQGGPPEPGGRPRRETAGRPRPSPRR